jgi:hypothetical protein
LDELLTLVAPHDRRAKNHLILVLVICAF